MKKVIRREVRRRGFFARLIEWTLVALIVLTAPRVAFADSDKLPITFDSVASDLRKALVKVSLKEMVTKVLCLDGGAEKRTVCTYKLGGYMLVTAETEKGGKDIVGLTMICAPSNDADSLKCLISYNAAMMTTAPELDAARREKIIKTLINGIEVGNQTIVITDERKFMLQKSMGLWFHIFASGIGD